MMCQEHITFINQLKIITNNMSLKKQQNIKDVKKKRTLCSEQDMVLVRDCKIYVVAVLKNHLNVMAETLYHSRN